jgi:hypothetical protein
MGFKNVQPDWYWTDTRTISTKTQYSTVSIISMKKGRAEEVSAITNPAGESYDYYIWSVCSGQK